MPAYKIAPSKVSFGPQFTGENPLRPAAARSGRIFAGKLSAGGDFSWGRSYNGRDFLCGRRYFNQGRHINCVINFPGRIFHGETF